MKRILQLLSLAGLLMTIIPPFLHFLGKISIPRQNVWMLAGAIIWFLSASFWLGGREKRENQ